MKDKPLFLIGRLSSYQTEYFIFRILMVSLVALAFMLLSAKLVVSEEVTIPGIQYLKVIIIFNLISEGNVLLDNFSERFFPIPSRIKTRVLLHFILSLGLGFLAILYFKKEVEAVDILFQPITWLMFAFGFIFVFILIVISISLRITTKWISSQEEVKNLKQLKLKNDYNALQDQLNPHFMFNNLSVLKSMIQYDPESAIEFTQNFTDTYRYVLQSNNKMTVQLGEEMDFIESYLALHKGRLGDALEIEYAIGQELLTKKIPPLSLQLLVENAIKHNIAAKDEPLKISMGANNEMIWVENNVQPKETSYSTSKGLKNLVSRYGFLTEKKVVIFRDENIFRVELPLL